MNEHILFITKLAYPLTVYALLIASARVSENSCLRAQGGNWAKTMYSIAVGVDSTHKYWPETLPAASCNEVTGN